MNFTAAPISLQSKRRMILSAYLMVYKLALPGALQQHAFLNKVCHIRQHCVQWVRQDSAYKLVQKQSLPSWMQNPVQKTICIHTYEPAYTHA
jgi:hypothetical protein